MTAPSPALSPAVMSDTRAPDQGDTSPEHLLAMLAQARSLVWDTAPYVAPPGATDVRICRVDLIATGGMKLPP